eukprot:1038133-Prymnesium_polylepis.1
MRAGWRARNRFCKMSREQATDASMIDGTHRFGFGHPAVDESTQLKSCANFPVDNFMLRGG